MESIHVPCPKLEDEAKEENMWDRGSIYFIAQPIKSVNPHPGIVMPFSNSTQQRVVHLPEGLPILFQFCR